MQGNMMWHEDFLFTYRYFMLGAKKSAPIPVWSLTEDKKPSAQVCFLYCLFTFVP